MRVWKPPLSRPVPIMRMQDFASFEEYVSALGHPDLRMVALERECASWRMGYEDLDGIGVRVARDGGPCLFDATVSADGMGLLLCPDAAGKVTGNGATFGRNSVMVIPGRTHIQSASLDAVSWFSFFVPFSRLDWPRDGNGEPRAVAAGVIDVSPADHARLSNTLRRIAAAAQAGAFEGNPQGRSDASGLLVRIARDVVFGRPVVRNAEAFPGRHRMPRERIIERTRQLIESRAGAPVHLQEMAAAAGVSERTLHNAFREQFGLSPQRFHRAWVLNAARRELHRPGPDSRRVTDVLARLGVWEWGRFSRDYQRLFGELPSQTLRRAGAGG